VSSVLRRASVSATFLVLFAGLATGSATGTGVPASAVYGGLGSWLDIYAGPSWSNPNALVARARKQGVRTLYLETSNYSRSKDVLRPVELGRFVDTAHAVGIHVVAWYLPGFANPRLDARRALAAIRFRSRSGQAFDGFALDIEASLVRRIGERNARLLSLARVLRRAVPAGYPLGAIIPSPVGMRRHPRYWPNFPYTALTRSFDAFLPMAYFSYYAHTPQSAYVYGHEVMRMLHARIGHGELIHMIGGSAKAIPGPLLAGFVRAVSDCGAYGISQYAFRETSAADWAVLATAKLGGPAAPSCG
jgi:hypothetical protein